MAQPISARQSWNIVDSSAWIEFFIGSERAALYDTVIQSTSKLLVPVISIYEVHRFLTRQASAAQTDECLNLMRRSRVLPLTDARAIAASRLAQLHSLAMADAMMYACAVEFDATLWTQDVDYAGLAQVEYRAKSPLK